jgi:hypothetical protein
MAGGAMTGAGQQSAPAEKVDQRASPNSSKMDMRRYQ